jgi:hypothetical protein
MAGITLAQAEAKLAAYMAAEDAVLTGQSYSISGRQLTRADLSEIRKGIAAWEQRVIRLTSQGGIRVRGAVPL